MSRGREKFEKHKILITFLVNILNIFPHAFKKYLYSVFQNKKGISGIGIRYVILKSLIKKCGDNVSIYPGVYLYHYENLVIGDNVSIHPYCYLDAEGGIIIGNDVSIAHGTSIMSNSHNFKGSKLPIKDQGMDSKVTIIKNNIWIGAKTTILYGTTINNGVIIGANSVVTKDVEKDNIVAGAPAKVLKKRFHNI